MTLLLFVAILLLLVACGGADAPTDAATEVQSATFTSTLTAKHSGKCLDLKGGSTSNGSALEQESCSGSEAPSFAFTSVSGKSNTYTLKNTRSGKCVDIYKGYTSNGTGLIQYSCGEGANQQFKLIDAGGGYYQLVADHSGKCLDVYRAYTSDGTKVTQYTCHSASERGSKGNQLWKIDTKGNGGGSSAPTSPEPTPPGDDAGGSSTLSVSLMGKAPEKKTVTFRIDKPERAGSARLRLSVYDADKWSKGKLYINGNGPVRLFGDQATSANHNVTKTLTFPTPASWWKDGDNRLEFVHDNKEGFRIEKGELSFASVASAPPSAPTSPSDPDPTPSTPTDRGSYALRGDPGFSRSELSSAQREWYDAVWHAIDNPDQVPNATRLAKSDDSYEYRGNLQDYITSLLLAFRMTGDLRFLDEVDRLAQLMRAELRDSDRDGFLNWVNRYDKNPEFYNKDTQMAYDLKAHALIAMVAWALQNNRDLRSPSGVNYGAHADYWENYLVNHFEAKWRKRNGKASGFPFADYKGLHTYHSFMKWHYYMGKLTGDRAYTREAERMMDEMWDGRTFKETSSDYGTAVVWTRSVLALVTRYDTRSSHDYLMPQGYARYVVQEAVDLHFEKFDRYASSSTMRKMANATADFVMDKSNSDSFARDIGGGRSRAGIRASDSSRWQRMSQPRFAESGWSYLTAWDSSNKMEKIADEAFYDVSNKRYNRKPERVFIPVGMLINETLN